MEVVSKTYIDNSRFIEFICEMATQLTEMNFGADTYTEKKIFEGRYETVMTEEAQDFFNETYDDYEAMANNIMGVYSDNELTQQEDER
tara:strand:- start:4 stop:267 length:264 start_codon:yes stop_codon:yes gene_type:complete